MELVNQTALPAMVVVTPGAPEGPRIGMLVAKATFRLVASEALLDTDDPFPLFDEDTPTDVGILPADVHPRPQSTFEVILVGSARAPGNAPVSALTVAMSVGATHGRMAVFGDRWWASDGRFTAPRPFASIPLTYEHAFGGSCDVWLDDTTAVEVRDPLNGRGLGFDGQHAGEELSVAFGAAPGYPKVDYERRLPNVEMPDALIRTPDDSPDPVCWSPAPPDVGFSQIQLVRELQGAADPLNATPDPGIVTLRAHPDWQIPIPEAAAAVVLHGCTPDGPLAFNLPKLRVVADYIMGDRRGSRELADPTP